MINTRTKYGNNKLRALFAATLVVLVQGDEARSIRKLISSIRADHIIPLSGEICHPRLRSAWGKQIGVIQPSERNDPLIFHGFYM